MSFPIEPGPGEVDERGLFLVQDPEIRSKVLPLFSFDPARPADRPIGHGTTFRIDPWSRCLTAFHVVEHLLTVDETGQSAVLRQDTALAALEIEGIAVGCNPLRDDAWRPLVELAANCAIEARPFHKSRLRNLTELVVLRIRRSAQRGGLMPYWPIDLRRWRPHPGERVLALGFPALDTAQGDDDRPISQYMYGSIGEITDVVPADGARGRPWPVIRVAAHWPGGMSGGPVFNEAGHVVGVVSTGIAADIGSATFFSGWNMPERILGSIDPDNPGFFRCHAVFDHDGEFVRAAQDLDEIRGFATEHGLTDLGLATVNPLTGARIRLAS